MKTRKIYLIIVPFIFGLFLITGCGNIGGLSSPNEPPKHIGEQSLLKSSENEVSASVLTLDLTSGTTGTVLFNQSFNGETRGVDVTVLGASNLHVISMTLEEFNIARAGSRRIGARIYQGTGSLLASANTTVRRGFNQSVTIPIIATLIAGNTYRIAFFIHTGSSGNSANVFDPDPSGIGGFPYTEPNGLLRMDAAYSIASDSFPTNPNIVVPMIKIEVGQQ